MIALDTYKENLYGKILWECYRSKLYIIFLSLVYVLVSAAAVIFAISHNTNHGLIFYFIAALVVALSLWRINRVHNPVALPVQLSYVSLGDKADFQNWVERKQEEVMENT